MTGAGRPLTTTPATRWQAEAAALIPHRGLAHRIATLDSELVRYALVTPHQFLIGLGNACGFDADDMILETAVELDRSFGMPHGDWNAADIHSGTSKNPCFVVPAKTGTQ